MYHQGTVHVLARVVCLLVWLWICWSSETGHVQVSRIGRIMALPAILS